VAASLTPVPVDAHVRRHVVDARLRLPGEGGPVTVLFGASGAGKSTVLRVLAGLEPTEGGHVLVDGQRWDDGRGHRVPARRRGVGYLVQDHALFPHLGVLANVGYGVREGTRADRRAQAREALRRAGAEHLGDRPVRQLSGGEAQRVALARALAPRPRLLLLDEPLSALDTPTRVRLRADLRRLLLAEGTASVVVTHDRTEAMTLADRVAVMVEGTVRQVGTPAEVFDRPVDPEVAAVVGVETAVTGSVQRVLGDLVQVRVGSTGVLAPREPGHRTGTPVMVCIRAEDVALRVAGPGDPHPAEARANVLDAVVSDLSLQGPLVRVDLDAGFGLSAYLTRLSLAELALVPGDRVHAVVATAAVHCIPLAGA
jgi:molybdate transport system ATP-binding protein